MARAPRLAALKSMTAKEIKALPRSELRAAYQNLRKITASRVSTFEKHGALGAVPEEFWKPLPSSTRLSDEAIAQAVKDVMIWINDKPSTYGAYSRKLESFRGKMQESMPDMDLSTPEKMKDFGEYMGEMQERYGEMWHAVSEMARDIYRDMTKLNEDPRQFMRNYDYWKENVEAVNRAKDAAGARGRRRSTKPSTYLNQLKRGKIK